MDIPINLSIEDFQTTVNHDRGYICIHADGKLEVVGPIKDAALALASYVIYSEYSEGLISFELNKSILIEFDKNFKLSCLLKEKPPFFDELAAEFQKIIGMKAFW